MYLLIEISVSTENLIWSRGGGYYNVLVLASILFIFVFTAWFMRIERPCKLCMEGVTTIKPEINLTLFQEIDTSSKSSSLIRR